MTTDNDYPIKQFRCSGTFAETKYLIEPKKEYSIQRREDEFFYEFTIELDSESLSDIELISYNYLHELETPYSGLHTSKPKDKAFNFNRRELTFRSIYCPHIHGYDYEDPYFLQFKNCTVKGYFYCLDDGSIYAHASHVDLVAAPPTQFQLEMEDEEVQTTDDDW